MRYLYADKFGYTRTMRDATVKQLSEELAAMISHANAQATAMGLNKFTFQLACLRLGATIFHLRMAVNQRKQGWLKAMTSHVKFNLLAGVAATMHFHPVVQQTRLRSLTASVATAAVMGLAGWRLSGPGEEEGL